ncbi:cytochrome P450 [Jimgerdemannia flammicorona]|uniref:Cytochrome P450 n=1 Tax=Jimgerdemannia flammicorona TaxID=994334 RepID=A0A433DIS2_9FUNG|nr:cytochrome P450 [Jimgerdemannia flammicorona]
MENLKNILTTVNWNDRNTIFATVAAVASVAVAVQLLTTSLTKPLLPLPPSPKGRLPVLGHLLAVSTSSHLTFTEWSKQLGPIFSIQLGSQTWIILTSSKVIRDLVDLRGSIYSDRHNNPIADILSRNGEMYGFAKNGDYLRMWRRLTNNTISKSKLQANFNHVFDRESRELLARLLRDGARLDGVDVDDVTYLYTINVMLSILYNRRCATSSDPLVQEIRGISNDFIEFGSDIFLNFFPILITFFAGKKRRATALQDRLVLYIESLVEEVRQKLAKGEQIPCVAAEFVKVQEKEGITDMGGWLIGEAYIFYYHSRLPVIQTCGGFTLAGVDNSAILLMNSAIILANHPEIQDRVHHELFATVGPDRLPEQSDAEKTPYVEAFLLEMFRFRPPGFFGIPHCSTEDDVYEGYRIP